MKVKGKFLGGLIGVCCGGPLGLLAGLAVGHIVDTFSSTFSDAAGGGLAFAARERFVEYICEGISKIAKADGRVSELEIAEVEKIFAEAGFDSEMRSRAIGVFRASKATPDTLADVARRFAIAFPKYEFRENFFLMMIRVAACDGGINDSERSALVAAAEELGLNPANFPNLGGAYSGGNYGSYAGGAQTASAELSEAYGILGVEVGAPIEEVKKAYHGKCKELHPDVLRSKGVGEAAIKAVEAELKRVNDAYGLIKRSR